MPAQTPALTIEATAYTKAQIDSVNAKININADQQIALAGRSNVGKSSLVNALANRKNIAKTSMNPGKTRSINYYRVCNVSKPMLIADLPGYGYAKCSKAERDAWRTLIGYYFESSKTICAIALLIDCRLDPQELDIKMADFAITGGFKILPVLTKSDKCNFSRRSTSLRQWRDITGVSPIVVSSVKKQGICELWESLINLCI